MWRNIRMALMGIAVVMSFVAAVCDPAALRHALYGVDGSALFLNILGGLVGLLLAPALILGVMGLQAVNPFSAKRWARPDWSRNFLDFGDPLHFFHFAGWLIVFSGAGFLLAAPFAGLPSAYFGAFAILAGVVVLLSVRLCMRVYRHKFEGGD